MSATRLRTDKQLRADFVWVLAGNIIYSACQWGIVVALAKLGNPKQVGEYALGMAVSAPIVLFANLQLRALLASESEGGFTFGEYLAFRLVSLGAALVVVAAAASLTQSDWPMAGVVTLVGLTQVLEYLSDTYYGFMQQQERMDRISISLLMKGPLSLASLCLAMYLTGSVLWAIVGLVAGRLAILLAWDTRLNFHVGPSSADRHKRTSTVWPQWHGAKMLALLRMALPLGFISMLISLNSSIPRYYLEAHAGSAELGIFSAMASLLTAGTLVVSAFGQSIFLPVARACAVFDRKKFRSYAMLTAVLGGGIGVIGAVTAAVFGRYILAHLFRPEYGESAGVLVRLFMAGSVAFIASGLGYVITAARRLGPQIPVLAASALTAAGASAWSIPRNGMSGAVDAILIAAFVQLVGTLVILWKTDWSIRDAAVPRATVTAGPRESGAACGSLSGQEAS